MSSGGSNGGVKIHLFAFLERIKAKSSSYTIHILCQESLVPELAFLYDTEFDHQIHIIRPQGQVAFRNSAHKLPLIKRWPNPPTNLLQQIGADLLYAGFGISEFHDPSIPQISLIVDCLHYDEPAHLPPEETESRNNWYPTAVQQAALIQTNSDFCIDRLDQNLNVDRGNIFRIYLPLHERFNSIETASISTPLIGKKFFIYPANFWSHKNHLGLLIAYNKYLKKEADSAWDLVLTGYNCDETENIKKTAATLGIQEHLHFLGHLPEKKLKRIWSIAGALVFPSLYEGFGLPLVEAMYFQVPIVCSDTGSIPEIAGDAAIYFNPRKPQEIADSLSKISCDENLRKELVAKGIKRLELFDMKTESDILLSRIAALLSQKHPS